MKSEQDRTELLKKVREIHEQFAWEQKCKENIEQLNQAAVNYIKRKPNGYFESLFNRNNRN